MNLFGPAHLAILATVPLLAWLLSRLPRPNVVRRALGVFLIVNELGWWAYRLNTEGLHFPHGLPLQLCDVAVWITAIAAISLNSCLFDLAYYLGIAGAGMALLTPDLWAPFPSYASIYFFLAHGGVVATVLMLLWSRQARPRPGSMWCVFLALNVYAAALAGFDVYFGVNYMYLLERPKSSSLLDYFGPWPRYVLISDAIALGLFWLLYLPWRRPANE